MSDQIFTADAFRNQVEACLEVDGQLVETVLTEDELLFEPIESDVAEMTPSDFFRHQALAEAEMLIYYPKEQIRERMDEALAHRERVIGAHQAIESFEESADDLLPEDWSPQVEMFLKALKIDGLRPVTAILASDFAEDFFKHIEDSQLEVEALSDGSVVGPKDIFTEIYLLEKGVFEAALTKSDDVLEAELDDQLNWLKRDRRQVAEQIKAIVSEMAIGQMVEAGLIPLDHVYGYAMAVGPDKVSTSPVVCIGHQPQHPDSKVAVGVYERYTETEDGLFVTDERTLQTSEQQAPEHRYASNVLDPERAVLLGGWIDALRRGYDTLSELEPEALREKVMARIAL